MLIDNDFHNQDYIPLQMIINTFDLHVPLELILLKDCGWYNADVFGGFYFYFFIGLIYMLC